MTPDDVVQRRQCMGCGFCTLPLNVTQSRGHMEFDPNRGHHVPRFDGPSPEDFVCPGARMDLPALAQAKHGKQPNDPWLGTVIATRAAYACDSRLRSSAASGGVIPALLSHLFESGQIDCAYCVEPGTAPETATGTIIRRSPDLSRTHGSVYHPVNFGSRLGELVAGHERFAFVGLPCEIAALEMLKARQPALANRHIISIGLFCGGINTFAGVAYYLEGFVEVRGKVEQIAYRVGNWPGYMRVKLQGRPDSLQIPRIKGNTRWKILRYVIGFQGYWMLPRCRICPDQVADLADIAVGDPHLPRFRSREGAGFSAVITRTSRGETLFAAALASGHLSEESLSREEVIESQGRTLDNRRHALVYARVARWLGLQPPQLNVYPEFRRGGGLRHWISAWVDLGKLVLPRGRFIRWFYLPWQVFEYLFLTFAPELLWRRIRNLLRNH